MFDAKAFGDQVVSVVRDFVSRSTDALQKRIDTLEAAIKAIPAGKDGQDGAPGRDGVDGKDGAPGVNGKDGQPGLAGAAGKDGSDGISGKDGLPGADGKSITLDDIRPLLEVEVSKWALDFERRAADVLQRAIDKIPAPKDGIDGKDGLSIEDFSLSHDGDGGVILRFARGEVVKEFPLRLPRLKDCGVFREGVEHKAGDGVTFGGSFFIAQKDAPEGKPGDGPDWRLAVKRGRDGKDGGGPTNGGAPAGPVRLK